jgi:hypothetical protein
MVYLLTFDEVQLPGSRPLKGFGDTSFRGPSESVIWSTELARIDAPSRRPRWSAPGGDSQAESWCHLQVFAAEPYLP